MKGKLSLLYNIHTRHHQAHANDIWNWKKDEYRMSREKMLQPYWWWWFSHSVKINPSLLVPPKLKWKNNILQRLVYATEYSLKILLLLFIYYFWLHCRTRASSNCRGGGGYSPVAGHGLLIAVASLVAEHTFQGTQTSVISAHGLSSCGAHRLSCPKEWGIFQDQGWNSCPLHWQADS